MAKKYIALVNGIDAEIEASVTGGTPDKSGNIVGLDSSGRLSPTIMPVGIVADTYSGVAQENLSSTSPLVYIRPDGSISKASGSIGGNESVGFVLENTTAASNAVVYFEGRITGLSGLTVGSRYYLSDTVAGSIMLTPIDNTNPSNSGKKHQYIGRAITTTSLAFEPSDYILLA